MSQADVATITITIDGQQVTTRPGIPVLQAALEMGLDVPHYCYHPGLSVVASCRLCLMEMKMPHPKTGELGWAPKLMPSCQTPVRDGLEVRFDSDTVKENQSSCMEYFLLNHPLDCPVCDQAGECYLQDYSFKFGSSTSRMVDPKWVNPKKDIGSKTLLYQDRCVMCTRCVRFCDEVAGSGELAVVNRGSRAEIDVFPGRTLENPLQGNVVDICPVGSLLDKDFLFKQRVWFLNSTPSICPGCSTGCAVQIDHNDGKVWRLKPRFNPGVNDWWICDAGRFGWKHVHALERLHGVRLRRGESVESMDWSSADEVANFRLEEIAREKGGAAIAVMLSPFLACEEAWLLVKRVRAIAPQATLVLGPVPTEGQDERFPGGASNGDTRFIIRQEKCPNRAGIEKVMASFGGPQAGLEDFVAAAGKGAFAAAWITGGYLQEWVTPELAKAAGKIDFVVVHDLLPSPLADRATLLLAACSFVERSGSFINADGKVQPFEWAVRPPDGGKRDGQFYFDFAGGTGIYRPERVRDEMVALMPEFADVQHPPAPPEHLH